MKPPNVAGATWLSRVVLLIAFCAVLLHSHPASAGRWAADTLSNDDASDLLNQIVTNGGLEAIRSALNAALISASPVNDEKASRALAAAEMVAAMMGDPSRHLPAPCKEWARLHSMDANRYLVQSAVGAVDRIVKDSETQELMQEGGRNNLQEWQVNVANLQARLIGR